MVMEEEKAEAIFKDIRRYYCEYCGICRSKKSLISSHILSHHQDEAKEKEQTPQNGDNNSNNTCQECGVSFRKPAYLNQHMLSHSLQIDIAYVADLNRQYVVIFGREALDPINRTPKCKRLPHSLDWISTRRVTACEAPSSEPLSRYQRPFVCTVGDCSSSYRRKDHLTRHVLQHQGKLFECPVGTCKIKFVYQGNMTRHLKEFHDEDAPDLERPKEYVCPESGCGKTFKYPSKLRKHDDSHVKLDTCEAVCSEPGCMKIFSNKKCLHEHIWACHQYIECDQCGGSKHLKKNIKRHLRMHEGLITSNRIKCGYEGCSRTFSTTSNLNQHIKATHLELKPFACCFPDCGMTFAFKHVRDNHEKSGCHLYTADDFEELDEQFRLRPRGGRKRCCPSIETLTRKRVITPSESNQFIVSQGHT